MKIKVKCINSRGLNGALTKGKVYEVINSWSDFYIVINDNGIQDTYAKNRFEVVEEITVHIGLDIGISEPIIIQEIRVIRKLQDLDEENNNSGFWLSYSPECDEHYEGLGVIGENGDTGIFIVESDLWMLKGMGFKFKYEPLRNEKQIMNDLVEKEFKFGEGNYILIKHEHGYYDYMNNMSFYTPGQKYYSLESLKKVVKELNELLESENNV